MLEECWSRREYNEKRKMRFLSKKNEQKDRGGGNRTGRREGRFATKDRNLSLQKTSRAVRDGMDEAGVALSSAVFRRYPSPVYVRCMIYIYIYIYHKKIYIS